MIGSQKVAKAVISRLAADTGAGGVSALVGGRIYRDEAPRDAALPVVVVQPLTDDDTLTLSGDPVWSNVLVQTKVVGEGATYTGIEPVASRVYAQLQGYTTTVDGVYVVKLRRESAPPQPVEHDGDRRYVHLNQVWRSEARPA